jgi:uncharacterized protein (DUF58 family)
MLSADVIAQIKKIELRAGHLVTEALAGNYLSAFKGRGMEFDQVREYIPGDDVRSIDWNVTARMNHPFVKVHREEREQTLMLMVDASPSQMFGSGDKFKNELSAELAAVLAFLATKNNDKVGLIAFSDHVEKYIPPKKGRAHVWRIIKEVLTHEGKGKGTNIAGATDFMQRVLKRRSMCFLISDFHAEGFERSLLRAAKRHRMVGVVVRDPRESALPAVGFVEFEDAETGERLLVDSSSAHFREQLQKAAEEDRANLQMLFRKSGVDSFPIETDRNFIPALEKFLLQQTGRKRL